MSDQITLMSALAGGSGPSVVLNQDGPWQVLAWGPWNYHNAGGVGSVLITLQQSPDGGMTWFPVNYMQSDVTSGVFQKLPTPVVISGIGPTGAYGGTIVPSNMPVMPIHLPNPCLVQASLSGATDDLTSVTVVIQPLSSKEIV